MAGGDAGKGDEDGGVNMSNCVAGSRYLLNRERRPVWRRSFGVCLKDAGVEGRMVLERIKLDWPSEDGLRLRVIGAGDVVEGVLCD
jgi:hypothetical protein